MHVATSASRLFAVCLAHQVHSFVLTGQNSSLGSASLPGNGVRWTMPLSTTSTEGLGGGIAWVLDPSFCQQMLPRFPERTLLRGIELPAFDFIGCAEIQAAMLRGFSTWEENHPAISFSDITLSGPCATRTALPDDACPWELFISTDNGGEYPDLAAYVFSYRSSQYYSDWYQRPLYSTAGVPVTGVDTQERSLLRFQTHLCWYLDATFCYTFQQWKGEGSIDVDMLVRVLLFTVFGLACLRLAVVLFFVSVAILCVKGDRAAKLKTRKGCSARCSAVLDYVASLSPCGNLLTLFCLTFPPIFYDRIFLPCLECYDFEAAMAHEIGHVLGFGHPDQRAAENVVAAPGCAVDNSTCRNPFGACALNQLYTELDMSIMHSLTQQSPRTCLSQSDMDGLHLLYPLCDQTLPLSVSCTKARQLSGWLRLSMTVGVPFLLAALLVLTPLSCLRYRDQKRMRQLTRAVGTANEEIKQYQQTVQTLRTAVAESVRPMTAALQHRLPNGVRPPTANLRRAVRGETRRGQRSAKVDPSGGAAVSSTQSEGKTNAGGEHRKKKARAKVDPALKLQDVEEGGGCYDRASSQASRCKPPTLSTN